MKTILLRRRDVAIHDYPEITQSVASPHAYWLSGS
jgi:hypothetical protein